MSQKVYIKYCRPYKNENDEPPIEEIWGGEDTTRPKAVLADGSTLYVYDYIKTPNGKAAINERLWDGVE